MKKTILLFLVLLVLFVAKCCPLGKDEILGAYQKTNGNFDNVFVVFEKTNKGEQYCMTKFYVCEDSNTADLFEQYFITIDATKHKLRVLNSSGYVIAKYFPESKLLKLSNNVSYNKVSDKKLNDDEMKKYVTNYLN